MIRSMPRLGLGALPSARVLRRRLLAALLLAIILAAGYWLWLRDSGLVAISEVSIRGEGERTDLAAQVEAVALQQTSLHVDEAALLEPISSDPAVRGLRASPDFPHRLAVELDLRSPVAYLSAPGLVVASDGIVLERSEEAPPGVPEVSLGGPEAAAPPGERVTGEAAELAIVLGAAPGPLLGELEGARTDPARGIVVVAGEGLELRFGGPERADAKWEAAAAVLADPQLGEVSYIDLSLPERPVAGSGVGLAAAGAETDAASEAAGAASAETLSPPPEAAADVPGEAGGGGTEITPSEPSSSG